MKRLCEICGSDETELIFKQRFVNPSSNYLHSGYNVVVCKICGFAFADKTPDQKFLDRYYNEMAKKSFYKTKRLMEGKENPEEDFLIKQLTNSANNIEKYLHKNSSILDIGCDTGTLLYMLKKRGYKKVYGTDMSELSSKIAKKKYGIDVAVGGVFDDLNVGKSDFIILTHVLEHIKNLNIFISKLESFMNEDGLIYIEVPDAYNFFFPNANDKMFSNDQKEPYLQFSVEHINYFSKISLFNLMAKNGFEKIFLESQISTISVIASIWKRRGMLKDDIIAGKLKKYVFESGERFGIINDIIEKLQKDKKEIFIWGAGLHTQKLLSITNLAKLKIRKFIDSDPSYHDQNLIGKRIINPKILKNEPGLPILISTKRYQKEIIDQIRKMGLKNKLIKFY